MADALLLLVALIAGMMAIVMTVNMQCAPLEPDIGGRWRDLLAGWRPMWSVRLERRHSYPFCRIIPLPHAAEIARAQTLDTCVARTGREICDGAKVNDLSYYAAVLSGADWVALYGCRRNSRRLERINRVDFKDTRFVDDGAALKRYWEGVPIYTNVHMCRRDLGRRIQELIAADRR